MTHELITGRGISDEAIIEARRINDERIRNSSRRRFIGEFMLCPDCGSKLHNVFTWLSVATVKCYPCSRTFKLYRGATAETVEHTGVQGY